MASTRSHHLTAAWITGVAGTLVSFVLLFLCASCCSGSIVPEGSWMYQVVRAPCLPGAWVAKQLDQSGGWLSLYGYVGTSFAMWAAIGGIASLIFRRSAAPAADESELF